jgi:lysophospholipase L1-like esterase
MENLLFFRVLVTLVILARWDCSEMLQAKSRSSLVFVLFLLNIVASGFAQTHWVGSWATSQQVPEPRNALAEADLQDATLRQIVHLSLGGTQLRVKVTNRYGVAPLHLTSVHIAKPVSPAVSAIIPGTDKALTFLGKPDVVIPAGADYLSDAVTYPVPAFGDLTITMHIDVAPTQQTGHPGSRATSYFVHGDSVSAADLTNPKTVEHWYFIAGVDVVAGPEASSVVVLGDSITDGHGATTNGNDRWTDLLARRLQANPATKSVGVLNQGIGGNRVLLDSLGPNALARFDHDVLAQAGARWLIVLEGINDIGNLGRGPQTPPTQGVQNTPADHEAFVHNITSAYAQMIARAHTHGIRVIGATILPYVGCFYTKRNPEGEADREAINDWIRAAGHFDAVIDFDMVMRDPKSPERLLPDYDSGDHLHPSPAGYAAMADAIPLSLFSGVVSAPKIAFTFDDLPAHSLLPPGETRQDVATKIITALHDARMPPIYGFVNGVRIEEQPADMTVLLAWHGAGNPLGNHTWSHMNLNQHTMEEFTADLTRNEPLLNKLMGEEDWHWFRFPYLAEGDTSEKRVAVRNLLAQRGYKIAGVTMSFSDYLWNEPYARCKAKGDTTAIALLESSYLAAADDNISRYREMSHKLYGRDIPYVLLMHIGAFDAEMLPRLLNLYRARGFQFVTLDEAESNEFYREDTDLHLPPGPDSLEGVMNERQLPVPGHAVANPKFDEMCR